MPQRKNRTRKSSRPEPSLRLLYSKSDAAKILGISRTTVETMYFGGQLPATRIRGRVLFHVDVLKKIARTGVATEGAEAR